MSAEVSEPLPGQQDGQQFELDGVSLWAKVSGQGRPVVLLHGVTANAYIWDAVGDRLAESVCVIAVDQRGHGRTGPAADGDYSAAAFARDVAGLAAVLGEPIIVAGHSLGSRNAIESAARYPAAVAGIAAIDFTPFIEPPVLETVRDRVAGGDRSFADLGDVRAYLRERYALLPPDAIERRARYGYRRADDGRLWPLADPRAMRLTAEHLSEDLAPALARIRVPAVLVRGADSAVVSAEALRRTCELRPDLPVAEVTGADHHVPEERPDDVADIVLRLAARIERS
jgi:2-(acetamidomethylene)succinate hydrolase